MKKATPATETPTSPSELSSGTSNILVPSTPNPNILVPSTPNSSSCILVYVARHKPIYAPINAGCQGFLDAVAQVLTWTDNRFLQYRSAGGSSRAIWMPISVDNEFAKLLNTCRDTGVFVRVVPDSWFNSEGEDEDENGDLNVYSPSHTKLAKLDIQLTVTGILSCFFA